MSKFQIVKGVENRPHATILTGRSGIGKTFLASTIPNVFFICVEQGLKGASPEHVADLPRFERPRSLPEFLEMVGELKATARAQGIRHAAIDSLSGLERLVNKQTCNQESVAHMEAKDFKKVWAASMPNWQRLQDAFDALRDEAGVHVWLIAHGQETKTSTVDGDMFQTWDLALQGSGDSLSALRQMWRGWADHVLFIDWDADVTRGSIGKKSVGKYKSRILRTRETPSHYAKNRANLPPILPATWADLARAMAAGAPADGARLRGQVTALLPQLGESDRAAIEADMAKAKSTAAMSAVLSRAQGMLSAARMENEDDAPKAEATSEGAAEAAPERDPFETPPPAPERATVPDAPPMDPKEIAEAARGVVAAVDPDAAMREAVQDEAIGVALDGATTAGAIHGIVRTQVAPLKLKAGSERRARMEARIEAALARVKAAATSAGAAA